MRRADSGSIFAKLKLFARMQGVMNRNKVAGHVPAQITARSAGEMKGVSSMNHRQITKTFLDVAQQYKQDMAVASRYYK